MVNKIKDEETGLSYEPFRPVVVVDQIAALPQRPGWVRKGVIMNYKHLPHNVTNHEKAGYSIVYTKQTMTDQRAFSPDNKDTEKTVMQPIIKTSADGYKYLVMEIEEHKLNALKKSQEDEYMEKYRRSVKSLTSKKGVTEVKGGELNLNNKPTEE